MYLRVVVAIVVAGCAGDPPPPEPILYEDVGVACVDPLSLVADAPSAVRVVLGEVVTCGSVEEAWCTAELDGDTIVVHAEAVVTPPRPGSACPLVGLVLAPECETPPLPAGEWTLIYGDGSAEFVVPSEVDDPPCTG